MGRQGPTSTAITYLEDVVLGANDGIITSFAIVSGAEGGTLGPVVILVLGLANVLADGVSMGASNWLAKRSRRHYTAAQKEKIAARIRDAPDEELAELARHMADVGIEGADRRHMMHHLSANKQAWMTALVASRADLAEEQGSPIMHALMTLAAFVVGGFFPLVPYIFGMPARAFQVAAAVSAVALFSAGALRAPFTGQRWLRSGFEMLAVGSAAGAVAYGVGLLGSIIVR